MKAQETLAHNLRMNKSMLFEYFEAKIKEFSVNTAEQNKRLESIHNLLNYNIQYKNVLNFAAQMTEIKAPAENDLEEAKEKPNVLQMALLNNPGSGAISLANIAGTCLTSEAARMKRIIFRATRGLALTFFHDIKEPLIMSNG